MKKILAIVLLASFFLASYSSEIITQEKEDQKNITRALLILNGNNNNNNEDQALLDFKSEGLTLDHLVAAASKMKHDAVIEALSSQKRAQNGTQKKNELLMQEKQLYIQEDIENGPYQLLPDLSHAVVAAATAVVVYGVNLFK